MSESEAGDSETGFVNRPSSVRRWINGGSRRAGSGLSPQVEGAVPKSAAPQPPVKPKSAPPSPSSSVGPTEPFLEDKFGGSPG